MCRNEKRMKFEAVPGFARAPDTGPLLSARDVAKVHEIADLNTSGDRGETNHTEKNKEIAKLNQVIKYCESDPKLRKDFNNRVERLEKTSSVHPHHEALIQIAETKRFKISNQAKGLNPDSSDPSMLSRDPSIRKALQHPQEQIPPSSESRSTVFPPSKKSKTHSESLKH